MSHDAPEVVVPLVGGGITFTPLPEILIPTNSGRWVNLTAPDPSSILFADIAWHLGSLPRWLGATTPFYSVAEHSSLLALHFLGQGNEDLARWALIHDAPEYVTGEFPAPIKRAIPWLASVEETLFSIITKRLGLGGLLPEDVDVADRLIRNDEKKALFPKGTFPAVGLCLGVTIEGLDPGEATARYRALAEQLFGDLWK